MRKSHFGKFVQSGFSNVRWISYSALISDRTIMRIVPSAFSPGQSLGLLMRGSEAFMPAPQILSRGDASIIKVLFVPDRDDLKSGFC